MGFVTPPIHFGRVILYVWSSPFLSVFYATCALGSTYVSCVCTKRSIMISLKTSDLPSGEGALTKPSVRHIRRETKYKTRHGHSTRGIISVDRRWCLQAATNFVREMRRLSNDVVLRGE